MNGGVISLKAHMPKASRESLKLICGDLYNIMVGLEGP
jgi:hypothetical protein